MNAAEIVIGPEMIVNSIQDSRGIDVNITDKTYAEFIAEVFKDKFVEVYVGDAYEDINIEQITSSYPAVFCGKVISAFKECLIIQTVYINNNKEPILGNLLFLNERAIRALTQVANTNKTLQEMMLRSSDVGTIYKALIQNKKVNIK